MATLTLDRKRIPRNVRTDPYIRDCCRKMRVLLARKFNGTLPFVGALEFQKDGVAHLHILIGRFIHQKWLSDAWQSIGGGKIVDIRFVDVHRVSAYLTKYLAGKKLWRLWNCWRGGRESLPRRGVFASGQKNKKACGGCVARL
jgi:hypothetical protein